MNQLLPMGGNTLLNTAKGTVHISYDHSNLVDISLTAFLLNNSDKVQGDNGIIFYNQPTSDSGVATLLPNETIDNMMFLEPLMTKVASVLGTINK